MKLTTKTWQTRQCNVHKVEQSRDRVVTTHYPVSTFDSASSSSADFHLESARKTISTPILQASGDNVRTEYWNAKTRANVQEARGKAESTTKQNDMVLKESSSFVATNSELPIVDISAFDYDAYRFQLVEAALRKQYDDYQPPGDVVLNSIHLNNNDSTVAIRLNDRYHHSLFDFIEEYYDATKGMSKKETEYLHPLDHFLIKGTQKPETVERETETKQVDVVNAAGQGERSPRISFYDDTAMGSMQRRQDSITKRNLRPLKPRPSSAGADSTMSRRSMLQRSSGKKNATKFSKNNSSTDSVSSKRDTFSGSQKCEDKRQAPSSIDGVERESTNCMTISSIDTESIRSESSKARDDHSGQSRDSSVASRRCTSEKPQILPWLTGNPRISFNQKYGNSGKTSSKMFEASWRSSMIKKSSFLSKQKTSKQPDRQSLDYVDQMSTDLPPLNMNFDRSDKDGLKLDNAKLSNQLGKLEVIKSETEELPRADFPTSSAIDLSCRKNDSLGHVLNQNCPATNAADKHRSPAKNLSERNSPSGQVIETIDSLAEITQQPPGEPRLAQTRSKKTTNDESIKECSRKSSAKHDQPEKLGKVLSDRKQGSHTVGPVSAKQPPKLELSTDTFFQQVLRGNIDDLSKFKNNEKRKEVSNKENENIRMFKKDVKKHQENQQTNVDSSSAKLNACGRKNTIDSFRSKNEEKTSDVNRRKAFSAIRNFGSTSTAKSNLLNAGKLSSMSKSSQQRTTGSRLNTGLHDNVIGARSMQIRSSKSPMGERKPSRDEKPGRTEVNRPELKESGPDGLKLPRRDSKAGIAMQVGLKKYIKKLKRVLSDRDNTDIGELASLSLTDAILPDLESTLSSVEVQQVQDLLNMAEKKSELMQNNLSGLKKKIDTRDNISFSSCASNSSGILRGLTT